MSDSPPQSSSARRRQAERDIEEVRQQLSDGELDESTAGRLLSRYRDEISGMYDREQEGDQASSAPGGKASPSRRLIGALLLLGVFAGISITAFYAIRPRDGGFITGNLGEDVNLADVTNDQMEAVIAANPDIPQIAAMRLRLADRYFEEGSFSTALPHYLEALEGGLDKTRRARGLARVGWMSYLSGSRETAEAYLLEALKTDPDYDEAHLFLGLLYLNGGDVTHAIAHLEPLSDIVDLPEGTRQVIDDALDRARSSLDPDTEEQEEQEEQPVVSQAPG